MSENVKSNANTRDLRRIAFISLAAASSLIAGCTSSTSQESKPKQPVQSTTSLPVPKTVPSVAQAPSFDVLAYEANPDRGERIKTALQGFGLAVLTESKKPNSSWGPFDTFCNTVTKDGARIGTNDSWVSLGYVPKAGDECYIQHNPQYGGKNMQVSAAVLVGGNGAFTSEIYGAHVNTDGCTVSVDYSDYDKVPIVTIGDGSNFHTVGHAESQAEAEAIDDQAINCLNTTRP